MQLFPSELALANLLGQFHPGDRAFCSREEALNELRELSGCDFGDDIELWIEWVIEDMAPIRPPKVKGLKSGRGTEGEGDKTREE